VIFIGDTFKPLAWKANFDMEFSSECLYCDTDVTRLKGYRIEDEKGSNIRVAVCPNCQKVNAKY
jgi:hypothetical protein